MGGKQEPRDVNLSKTYAQSTTLGWFRIGVVRGTQLIYLFFIARMLTVDQLGYVEVVGLGITLVTGVVTPWLVWVMVQKALAEPKPGASVRLVHQMATYAMITTVAFAPLLSLFYVNAVGISLFSQDAMLLILVACVMCVYQVLEGAYATLLRISASLLVSGARYVANYLIPLALYFLTGNITMIFWGWLIADLLIVIVAIPTCGLRRDGALYRPRLPTKELVVFTLPIFFIFLFQTLRTFTDRYLILFFFGEASLAVYHTVSRITAIASEAILTLLIPFQPIMTALLRSRPEREAVALSATLKMLVHAVLYVVPVLVFCGAPVILFILSAKYLSQDSVFVLAVASLGTAFLIFNNFFTRVRGAKGETYKLLVFELSSFVGLVLFLCLFFVLGWLGALAIVGVAVCVSLSSLFAFAIMAWQTKELRLVGGGALARSLLLALPQTVIVIGLSWLLSPVDFVDWCIIAALSFLSIFVFSGLLSCFNSGELEILSRVSKKRLNPLIGLYRRMGLRPQKEKQVTRTAPLKE